LGGAGFISEPKLMNDRIPTEPILAEHVAEIRRLGKRMIADIVEIGRRLTECQEIVGHGGWTAWLDINFSWSDRTALNFMRVFELSKSEIISDFGQVDLPVTALYLLAAPSTSEAARTEILDRAKTGNDVSVEDVKEAIAGARAAPSENAKPLPDIVDGCVAAVRRRIEDTVTEIQSRYKGKSRAKIERLFAALTDTLADLEQKTLPLAEDDAGASAAQRKAHYTAIGS
jgi:hypothetical protein